MSYSKRICIANETTTSLISNYNKTQELSLLVCKVHVNNTFLCKYFTYILCFI